MSILPIAAANCPNRLHLVRVPASVALCLLASILPAANHPDLAVRVLSARPDLITGGSALVEIQAAAARVSLNRRDITGAFRPGLAGGTLVGRVEGLQPGENILEVRSGGRTARLKLLDHAASGPLFSGPRQSPFICQTAEAGLGPPLDAECSGKTIVLYYYRSARPEPPPAPGAAASPTGTPAGFKPLDPSAPLPPDLATTVTTEGKRVKYVVRRERGTINRAIYQIDFLHEPGTPLPDPWTATAGWNRRVVFAFGAGCSPGFHQGLPNPDLDGSALSRGYARIASTLNWFGNDCDDVISAETAVRLKEYFTRTFGAPVHTIGWGGSGGAMQQYLIAQNYPGVLDAITPQGSFPDAVTQVEALDCALLMAAFDRAAHPWSDEEKTAVTGFASWRTCNNWKRFAGNFRPENCDPAIPKSLVYDPVQNPKGVRCTLQDNQVNVYGRDSKTGYARRTFDNAGIQYGLAAFQTGRISADQFLDLNERIGGLDADSRPIPARSEADAEAVRSAYRTGRVNTGARLAAIPIVDHRNYVDRDANNHDRIRTFILKARLQRAAGRTDNLAILTNPPKDLHLLELMDRWLDGIDGDRSNESAETKLVRHKPAELAEGCWTADGQRITDARRCNELFPAHADPRLVAGAPPANDVLKCALQPVNRAGYKQPLTAAQFARLQAIFPRGVCDYSRPGLGQEELAGPWQHY